MQHMYHAIVFSQLKSHRHYFASCLQRPLAYPNILLLRHFFRRSSPVDQGTRRLSIFIRPISR
jgi:hypothetical protein